MSRISILHYLKLVFRSCLFIAVAIMYAMGRTQGAEHLWADIKRNPLMFAVWLIFVIEMILRFFPFPFESMGCQKQFKRNFKPASESRVKQKFDKSIIVVAGLWILLNGIVGVLYCTKVIDEGILVLISLAYSVCDMICILFFCPFQTWIMKNKCCTSCRIYNWDYAMMFTPMIFIKDFFALSLLLFAAVLLIRWEVTAFIHPEYFSETENLCLSCAVCNEKLCHHKKQLRHFLRVNKKRFYLKGNDLLKKINHKR